jgi:hypothetical protein
LEREREYWVFGLSEPLSENIAARELCFHPTGRYDYRGLALGAVDGLAAFIHSVSYAGWVLALK